MCDEKKQPKLSIKKTDTLEVKVQKLVDVFTAFLEFNVTRIEKNDQFRYSVIVALQKLQTDIDDIVELINVQGDSISHIANSSNSLPDVAKMSNDLKKILEELNKNDRKS